MKIIFLDFDGVLNSFEWWRRSPSGNREDTSLLLDPAAVGFVNQIIRRTGAKIVISSSWRISASMRAIWALEQSGFIGDVVGETPRGESIRGDEIQTWLFGNTDIESFIILDDNSDMGHLSDRLIQTSFATGITQEDADRAVALLGGPELA